MATKPHNQNPEQLSDYNLTRLAAESRSWTVYRGADNAVNSIKAIKSQVKANARTIAQYPTSSTTMLDQNFAALRPAETQAVATPEVTPVYEPQIPLTDQQQMEASARALLSEL